MSLVRCMRRSVKAVAQEQVTCAAGSLGLVAYDSLQLVSNACAALVVVGCSMAQGQSTLGAWQCKLGTW